MDLSQLDIRTLTVAQRLELMAELWESLAAEGPDAVPLLPDQEAAIHERISAHDSDPASARDWAELHGELAARHER